MKFSGIRSVEFWVLPGRQKTLATPKLVMWEWKRALPQLAAGVAIFILVYYLFSTWHWRHIFMLSAGIYLTYSLSSRRWIPRHHRKGMRLLGQKKYQEAILAFEDSLAFFAKHRWVDSYRAITLMTPSSFSYREMALMNIAHAHGQLDDGESSRAYYEQVVEEYPNNEIAQVALKLIEASTKITSRQ